MFHFKSCSFDETTYRADFLYVGADGTPFTETVQFIKNDLPLNRPLLNRALFLSFILIGTSYYKSHPTTKISFDFSLSLDKFQAHFFDTVYQEGLSQFAYENHLTRNDLAHFPATTIDQANPVPAKDYTGILSLQSGGKDSLLTATLFQDLHPTYLYVSSSEHYPAVLDQLGGNLQIIQRTVDVAHLRESGGLNGHVPITYIIQSLSLIQAIINHNNAVLTSIGREGNEPHAYIDDLPVNHQWSKTWPAEIAFAEYVHRYISPDLNIGSPLRGFSELKIAELFTQNCWEKYGHLFSSCNVANYRQQNDSHQLTWCGNCAKCANAYLLFAPFIPAAELDNLFAGQSLFTKPSLTDTFKGLLGIDGFMKPFECVGEIDELRKAYEMRLPDYPKLPFTIPPSDFDYEKITDIQPFIKTLFTKLQK